MEWVVDQKTTTHRNNSTCT